MRLEGGKSMFEYPGLVIEWSVVLWLLFLIQLFITNHETERYSVLGNFMT